MTGRGLLRFLAMAASVSAALVMATSRGTTTTSFNITIHIQFYHTQSFTFFLITKSITSAYSLLALFLSSAGLKSRWITILDTLIAMLLTGSTAATGAILQVGNIGNQHAGWLPICSEVPKYCNHVLGALISGFAALLLYAVIVLQTIFTELNPLHP